MKKTHFITILLAFVLVIYCTPVSAVGITETDQMLSEVDPSAVPPANGIHGLSADGALVSSDALSLDGEAMLLYELSTGTMVYAKNIDEVREPASLTKLMTCLLALEYGDPSDAITVTDSALAGLDPAGSTAGLRAGETYTLEQLLYCLMVQSANDAAAVIAEYISGSQSDFVTLMNDHAQALGCSHTSFQNPHGLHEDGHVSSARDIARILSACLDYDLFHSLYSTVAYTLPATDLQPERTLKSTNYLISSATTDDYLDWRVEGGKTGFTTPAGRCVACVADDGSGYRYLAVVLGAGGTDSNGKTIYGSFLTASALFDFGFGCFGEQEALPAWTDVAPMEIACGDCPLEAYTTEGLTSLLPWDFDASLIRTENVPAEDLAAPVFSGDPVGETKVYYGDVLLGRVPMEAANDVAYVEPRAPLPKAKSSSHGIRSMTLLPKAYSVAMVA